MKDKQDYHSLIRSIQDDYKIDLSGPDIEMLAIYEQDTLARAERMQAPGIMRIIRLEELQDDALAQFESFLGFEALAFVIGKREQVEAIAGPQDQS